MAIYHLSIKIISRGKGKSAVAAAAYRAGEIITNEYDGVTHNYTGKGGVVYTEILLPSNTPAEYADRSVLWNAVEKVEKAINSQLAREIQVALPKELSREQQIELACEYVKQNFVDKGMCADICIHDTGEGNPHAHIMLTMRPFNEDKTWGAKSKKEYILDEYGERIKLKSGEFKSRKVDTTDWNEQTNAEQWRKSWAETTNRYLKQLNHNQRIDYRSYERQGLAIKPTIHLGATAWQMEKKGIATERGDINRSIADFNKEVRELEVQITELKTWLYSQPIENAPTHFDTIKHIGDAKVLNNNLRKFASLQTQEQVEIFLQSNNISGIEHFVEKVTQMRNDLYDVFNEINEVDRRLDTLDLHLAHYENLRQCKAVYMKYINLAPEQSKPTKGFAALVDKLDGSAEKRAEAQKKQNDFYNKYSEEIEAYKDAGKYFKVILNDRGKIPIQAWKKEQTELIAARFSLTEKFYILKDKVKNTAIIQRKVKELMRDTAQRKQPQRTRGIER